MQGGGKVGVVIFFSISAWFFLDKEQTIKSNLKRVWIMERELLFWSLTLMTFYFAFDRTDLSTWHMLISVAPLYMGTWWYATAYALFLALLPFLSKGLKALGKEIPSRTRNNSANSLGINQLHPRLNDDARTGPFGFIYLFILIAAYKWYMKPFGTKQIGLLLVNGLSFFALYDCLSVVASMHGHDMKMSITDGWQSPVLWSASACFFCLNEFLSAAVSLIELHNLRSPYT